MAALVKIVLLLAFLGGVGYGATKYVGQEKARQDAQGGAKGASGGAQPRGGGAAKGPLPVEVFRVAPSEVGEEIPAIGTLVADELVEISSEQSRRLIAIEVEEGASVEEGAILYRLDDSDLQAQLRELQARRELAAATERRVTGLIASAAVPQSQLEEAQIGLRVIDAQIDLVKTTMAKTLIRAPFAGRLGMRRVSLGAWLTPDRVITNLQRTERIKVDFKLPERFASAIKIGDGFSFRTDGKSEWTSGTVTVVDPQIDPASRSVVVRGVAPNPEGLMPGAFVSVRYRVEGLAQGFMIPTQAIVPSAKGSSVWVVDDGKATARPVELGMRTPDEVQILGGLAEGDEVIVSNLLRVNAGSKVEVR